jgi:tripartite-type tricarboxylate transporter receptor subunit TctC
VCTRGAALHPSTPGEFAATIRSDIEKWARVVKRSGARIE